MKDSKLFNIPDSLKLNEKELETVKMIQGLSEVNRDSTIKETVLSSGSILTIIKLSIYSPLILDWCRQCKQSIWKGSLATLEEKFFEYKFQPQQKIPVFDLLAGLVLAQESKNKNPAEKIFILYVAMEKFYSFYATLFITDTVIPLLNEKVILSMTRILVEFALKQGAPGYFIFGLFCEHVASFFQKTDQARASNALYLSYHYLLTASFLEQYSQAEIHNAKPALDFKTSFPEISLSKKSIFVSKVDSFERHQSKAIQFTKVSAYEEARRLSLAWRQ